jgi:beta-glucosidase
MYLKEKPLYPFGYGLSYTQFEITNQSFEKNVLSKDDVIEVSFDVQNVGEREGSEVVQLYVHEHKDSKYTAIKILKAFERVFLNAGEKQQVTLSVPVEDLATYSLEEKAFVTNAGTYDIMIGNSSDSFYFQEEINIR